MGDTSALQTVWPFFSFTISSFCGFLIANGTNRMNRQRMDSGTLIKNEMPRKEYFGSLLFTKAAKMGPKTAPKP